MATGQNNSTINVAGLAIASSITRTADTGIVVDPTLPAGKTGTLSTRTSDSAGVATLASGHGVTTADVVDVYWTGGVRYGCDVSVVATDDVTFGTISGGGDVLPAQDTALIVTPRVEFDVNFDGDLVEMVAAGCDKRAHIEFTEDDDTSIHPVELVANAAWSWATDTGVTNDLAGNPVGKIQASCGEASAGELKIGVLYDAS